MSPIQGQQVNAANRKLFLIVTALAEGSIGLGLLLLPSVPLALLLGLESAAVEAVLVGRIAGAALVAIATASWAAKAEALNPAVFGLLSGILIYNTLVLILLVYASALLKMAGVLLWPTVVAHAVLAVWGALLLFRGEIGDSRRAGS